MSNPKDQWDEYLPRLDELYNQGFDVPNIQVLIQDKARNFTPSLVNIYSKLRECGYSTDARSRTGYPPQTPTNYLHSPTDKDPVEKEDDNIHTIGIFSTTEPMFPGNGHRITPDETYNVQQTRPPLQDDPPMPQDIFLHYLCCSSFDPAPAWLPRLPKKIDSSILRFTGAINEGCGIRVNEGPNWFTVGMINLCLMIMSGIAAVLWKYFMNDFQGAFGFAGWIVAVANAVLVAYIAKWSHA